ncbi:Phytochrome-like protein cph1 [Thalassocella blandensis]|nr:Phytochrome-like protein cph1 [Thalassocella blandensis]
MSSNEFIKREELSEEELQEAIQSCADEPIHRPNLIQPHGFMLVVNKESFEILQASENVEIYLGKSAEDCLGLNLDSVVSPDSISVIKSVTRNSELIAPYSFTTVSIRGEDYDVVSHYSASLQILEFEPIRRYKELPSNSASYEKLRQFAVDIQNTETFELLCDKVVDAVRTITGFDRVKLYMFDEMWNGSVIAESREDYMPSYKGLCFPSQDIPEQARRLYSVNYLRLIPDIRYKPSPLVPNQLEDVNQPLDMTYSVLRSVSPVHIQYLENINIQASMSISVLQDQKLWGLIACHHSQSKYLPYSIRVLSEIIGHIFSAKLTSMRKLHQQEKSEMRKILRSRISAGNDDLSGNFITNNNDIAIEAIEADSLVVVSAKHLNIFGEDQNKDTVRALYKWYLKVGHRQLVYTNDCSEYFKHEPELQSLLGGVLIVPIGVIGNEVAIWFRKAVKQVVNWAGNPEKPLEKTKAGYRLTPRSSFELWQTTVKNRCKVWSYHDIETAESIAHVILENEKIRAELANSAKTEFLSNMSHELRTPLGAIISIIQVLNRDNTITHEQAKLITSLEVSADTLMLLINDLLDISKIEANEMALESIAFSMRDVMEGVRSMMAVKSQEKGLSLNVDYRLLNDLLFEGDKSKLRQVLINLVNNAIKFTERGGINIVASIDKDEDHQRRTVTIEVIDSGIGISPEHLEKIFEKFVQADNSISRRYGGTGLGLSICRSFIDLMGGNIDVKSQVGLGTNFTLRIPFDVKKHQTVEAVPAETQDNVLNKQQQRIKVLLTEDYEGNIIAVLDYLQKEGFEVVIARNGQAAVDYVKTTQFDCVLMDVQMPIMDGLSATRIIREMQRQKIIDKLPIIGMTANALKEDKERCLAAGMDDYISKPMSLAALKEKIKLAVADKKVDEVKKHLSSVHNKK